MEIRDIADLFIEATGKIEFYWNFYTVTVLALIGWLVSTDKVLRPGLKSLITVGYLVFALRSEIHSHAVRKDRSTGMFDSTAH